jgi:hypothetical protein
VRSSSCSGLLVLCAVRPGHNGRGGAGTRARLEYAGRAVCVCARRRSGSSAALRRDGLTS